MTAIAIRASENAGIALRVLLGSLLLALCSQIVIPLPFSPVPISLGPAVALLLGVYLGPVAGTLSVATYLIEGGLGLPFFGFAHCGLATLLGPTGGYLLGYVPGAYIAGRLASRPTLAFVLGMAAIFACGLPQLALFVGWSSALLMGLFPFLPGEVLKGVLFRKCVSS